jgi:hypothetical protein
LKGSADLAHEIENENVDAVFAYGGIAGMDRRQHEQLTMGKS